MRAYRVSLMGTNDTYLITEKQKPVLSEAMSGKGSSTVDIGGDIVRVSSIKAIRAVNVDFDSCPDYFKMAVEKGSGKVENLPSYRKLPTEWVILTTSGQFLTNNLSNKAEEYIANMMLNRGNQRYLVANCHYRINENGDKEYLTKLEEIPKALKKRPEPDNPASSPIVQIYHYGEKQIDVDTGIIKGVGK